MFDDRKRTEQARVGPSTTNDIILKFPINLNQWGDVVLREASRIELSSRRLLRIAEETAHLFGLTINK